MTNPHNRFFFIRLCRFFLSPTNLITFILRTFCKHISPLLKKSAEIHFQHPFFLKINTPFLFTQHGGSGACSGSFSVIPPLPPFPSPVNFLSQVFYYSYSSLYINVFWNVHKDGSLMQMQRFVIYAIANIQSCGIRDFYR